MKTAIETKNLTLSYGDSIIINELDLQIPKGEITVFIGGNGCGKSTILRSIARLLKPKNGAVLLEGNAISKMSTKDVAKQMSILPQSPIAPEGLTVLQLVKQGRYPYQTWLKQWTEKDEEEVTKALKATAIEDLKDRPVDSLSGGQRQRAWIAMTLAQDTDVILLDEPTTYLDMTHQIEILDLLYELNEKEQRTIVMVLHDLNLACRYADNIVAIKDRKIYAQGKPEHIVSCPLVKDVFGMDCQITMDPLFGTPLCIPFGKGRCILKEVVL
ncbi:ABC transporter ATP-binding protein [Psychrobacillus lasiicapitis]|uniref:ABC transporter ATP-binding protein n=1 Tax=Psychrobacillus lasiicapitis TaxID=1636719 RepID=A0A544T4V1_9BACI|nr:ABC transporter ATP-binding protein [Psychrobacillus lasiicapitis]TQR12475.1 ABC transporter ATP-binding protein [Psychrobacillus lasiicapitis]GGA38415.1 putative siderophore transport system ATP-binding protein YusV [Psychrobacillus lasiicapitis]